MYKKVVLAQGDILEVILNQSGIKGYVRILAVLKGHAAYKESNIMHLIIDLLKIDPQKGNYSLDELYGLDVISRRIVIPKVCKMKNWRYFGNLPIDKGCEIPSLYKPLPFSDKFILYSYNEERIVSKEELGNALFAGTLGEIGVRIDYIEKLEQNGLL